MKVILKNVYMRWGILIVVEILILFLTAGILKHNYKPYEKTLLPMDLFMTADCADAIHTEDVISIDRTGSERLEKPVVLCCGPYTELPRGNYQITFNYETDTTDSTYCISTDEATALDAAYRTDIEGYFETDKNELVTNIRLLRDVDSFDIECQYYGTGRIALKSIRIISTGMNYAEVGILALFFILFNLSFAFYKKIKRMFAPENIKYTMTLLMLLFFSNIILFVSHLHCGSDIEFHMLRIEGIKEAILSGQIPSRIQPDYIRGYGYASGVMYPDWFLYIPAVFRLLGMHLALAYKCFVFLINGITIGICFYAFGGIFDNRKIALVGTVMYVLSPYRMIDVYYRAAVGEYCALMGLPLIVYGIYQLLHMKRKNLRVSWIPLTLGYSIVIESHILSAIFVTFFTLIIFLLFWKKIFTKNILISLRAFGVGVCTLNAWFIVPWLDYYRLPLNAFTDTIEKNGLMLSQIFINLHIGDIPGFSKALEDGLLGETPFGIGYALLFTTILFVLYGVSKKEVLGKASFGIGVVAITFSTVFFPWDKLSEISFLNKIVINIQFPWRFLMIATIALVICGCVGIEKASAKISGNFLCFCAILLAIYGFTAIVDGSLQRWETEDYGLISQNTFSTGTGDEYMLTGTDKEQLKKRGNTITASSEKVIYYDMEKVGTNIKLQVISSSNKEEFIELPLLLYPGYRAIGLTSGTSLNVDYGNNNVVRVFLPAGFHDTIRISFEEKWYWHIAEVFSLIALVVIIWIYIRQKKIDEV